MRNPATASLEPDAATPIAAERRRGRGALTNHSGRFEPQAREQVDDGWGALEELDAFKTEITLERAKTIITRNNSPDISFDRSINPYRGCEHGCVYCFARPTHAYMGLSPGLDFESRLFVKEGAAALLERELAAADYQPKTIAIGTNTDPYQPIERQPSGHAFGARGAGEDQSSGRHRDEIGDSPARYRSLGRWPRRTW